MRKPGRSAEEIRHAVVISRSDTGICTESPSSCRRKEAMKEAYTYTLLVMQSVTRVDGEAVTRSVFFASETWIAACWQCCGVCRFRKACRRMASMW
jgi:hypothetical protein